MQLQGDERGAAIQVGAVILFSFIVIAMTMWQVQVVPQQNQQVEFNHNERVQTQLVDLRSSILSSADGGGSRAVTVTLGTRYPSRTMFVNPTPPSGTLRTVGTETIRVNASITNARAVDDEAADFWNGSAHTYSTGAIAYEPNYNEYHEAPTVVYENTVVYNRFDRGNASISDQAFVRGDRVRLVLLNGSLSEATGQSVSVDVQPVSVSTSSVELTNATDPINVTVATQLSYAEWKDLLDEQRVAQGGHVQTLYYRNVSGGPNLLTVQLERDVTYSFEIATVGVGTNVATVDTNDAAYVSTDGQTTRSTSTGSPEPLSVTVSDAYGNPVAGKQVNFTVVSGPGGGSLTATADTTNDVGRASTDFSASTPGTYEINATINGANGEYERVRFTVTVTSSAGGGGGGGGGAYTIDWRSPTNDNDPAFLSSCSGTDCTWNVTKDTDDLLTLTAVTNPNDIQGLSVDFAINNSSVATLQSTSATTDANGQATTTIQAVANGTVAVYVASSGDSDVINITVLNDTGGGGGGGNVAPTASFTYSPGSPSAGQSVTFDASGSTDSDGTIATYEWDFNGDGTTDATGVTASHTYATSGTYTVTLTVTDDQGATDTATQTVTVSAANSPPTASFTYSPSSPSTGQSVTFDASGSTDDSGIAYYNWTVGDGTTINGSSPTTAHTYSSPGTYTVTLTVKDAQGATDTMSQTVTVTPPMANGVVVQGPASANKGDLNFQLKNQGAQSATLVAIAVNSTSSPTATSITENGNNRIFFATNGTASIATTTTQTFAIPSAKWSLDTNDTLTAGEVVGFELGRFVDNKGKKVDMTGQTVTLTLYFSDGSTKQVVLNVQ